MEQGLLFVHVTQEATESTVGTLQEVVECFRNARHGR